MASCLGIYVNDNIIKYAKVNKEKDNIKIETFGIKFYTDLKQTINQIISETFSFKIPISINITKEAYNYFSMSNLLNKKDLKKAIDTEFESLCYEKKYNPNALETRFALVNYADNKDKIKVIHVSADKMEINKILQNLDSYNIANISPLPISIANIAPIKAKENIAIINMDDITTVTTITGEKIYDIQTIESGAKEVLDAINAKENSYTKAYEICKNTTIYTMEIRNDYEEENQYLGTIIPTLYTISNKAKEIINSQPFKINKVYLTGTLSVVNNIELYFEEIINGTRCEILKPFFIEESPKNNIKDYIEVNSAIALAIQGLGYGLGDMNFCKKAFSQKLPEILTQDVTIGKSSNKSKKKNNIDLSFSNKKARMWLRRALACVTVILVAYIGISTYINISFNSKQEQLKDVAKNVAEQITLIDSDTEKVEAKTSEYQTMTSNLQNASNSITTNQTYKKAIPTLLSEIMYIIPKGVQLTSIENPTGKKIIINAQSTKYEQLAYFKSVLRSEGVLLPSTIVSSEAVNEGDIVKIVIEGELP